MYNELEEKREDIRKNTLASLHHHPKKSHAKEKALAKHKDRSQGVAKTKYGTIYGSDFKK
jgi:hypothetical protein